VPRTPSSISLPFFSDFFLHFLLAIVAALLSHFDNRKAHASRHVIADISVAIRFNLPLHKFPQKVNATFAFFPQNENIRRCFSRSFLWTSFDRGSGEWGFHLANKNLFHTFPLANIRPA